MKPEPQRFAADVTSDQRAWPALWALVVGFFMILVDTTIVSVANPRIMQGLHADLNSAIWVTSAYLLCYAVPLLVTGRLGDRYGPKRIYLIGLVVFTLASAWCGFAGSIEMLIAARAMTGTGVFSANRSKTPGRIMLVALASVLPLSTLLATSYGACPGGQVLTLGGVVP